MDQVILWFQQQQGDLWAYALVLGVGVPLYLGGAYLLERCLHGGDFLAAHTHWS